MHEPVLIFERSHTGRRGFDPGLETGDAKALASIPVVLRRASKATLPEVTEADVIRHYTALADLNFSVDKGFYPLGSCTMKYNPRINEKAPAVSGIAGLHPGLPAAYSQGVLHMMDELKKALCALTGMVDGTLSPFAGAHGEYVGMKLFKAYLHDKGLSSKDEILVPDSAHGTNPASAHLAGFKVITLKSDSQGLVRADEVAAHINERTAGIMMTNPNTLGLYETEILAIAKLIHNAGGLLYYDGANFNAIAGRVRPGDMGFDVIHLNLHKSFSTPHGGGGPGAGPVFVSEKLAAYLPYPRIKRVNGSFVMQEADAKALGTPAGYYGNIGVLVKAYAYILSMGLKGFQDVSAQAVLNANYLKKKLADVLPVSHGGLCMHEFVLSAPKDKVRALDIAKALIDEGIHPPTIYFPLIVSEALMIEPTETESIEDLDYFVEVMKRIVEKAFTTPEALHDCPVTTCVSRPDEVQAARSPVLSYKDL